MISQETSASVAQRLFEIFIEYSRTRKFFRFKGGGAFDGNRFNVAFYACSFIGFITLMQLELVNRFYQSFCCYPSESQHDKASSEFSSMLAGQKLMKSIYESFIKALQCRTLKLLLYSLMQSFSKHFKHLQVTKPFPPLSHPTTNKSIPRKSLQTVDETF